MKPATQSSPMRKIITIALFAAAGVYAVQFFRDRAAPPAPSTLLQSSESNAEEVKLPTLSTLHEFSLTERDGTMVTLASLKGKVWVANFMFTTCQGPCPLMSQRMASLQRTFVNAPDLRLVSITSDPANDTPAVLTEYANKFDADSKKWLFLTGDQQAIISLAQKAFRLPAGEQPDMHSTRFVLVDTDAQIRGYYDSQSAEDIERLKSDVTALLNGKVAS